MAREDVVQQEGGWLNIPLWRRVKSHRFPLAVAAIAVIGMLLLILGIRVLHTSGANLFRRYVLDPIPASVTDIRVDQTVRERGYGYVFRFAVNEADFRSIQKSRPLRECGAFLGGAALAWQCKDLDVNVPDEASGGAFTVYPTAQEPAWFDLPSWKDPEVWALLRGGEHHSTTMQVLIYNHELGQAYFITYYYDGRGL